jgi:N-acyl-L-homoserine lactone synthetase
MEFLSGTRAALPPQAFDALARFRHRVFVEHLGWPLPVRQPGLEIDQFDRADTVYVMARRPDGAIIGGARLLPTTRPYLLADIFPQLLRGRPAPRDASVWELSRFAALDVQAGAGDHGPMSQFSSPAAVGLLREAMRVAADRGARRLITVSPLGIERLLRNAGFKATRAAAPVRVDGQALFACLIDIPCHPVASLAGCGAIGDEGHRGADLVPRPNHGGHFFTGAGVS